MGERAADLGELRLLERIQAGARGLDRPTNVGVRVGIGDDCAVLRVLPGFEMVVTTDFCLEGKHFRRDWHSPESAGHRCLARGLSDVAAMGARPVAAFLSLAVPKELEVRWLDRFMAGLGALAGRSGVELAGGDTAEAPGGEVLADIVVVGTVERGRALRRSGAKVGDGIYVTGTLGGSAVELAGMAAGVKSVAAVSGSERGRQTFPEPRIEVGRTLQRRGIATSCMDLSDGLSLDLRRLCMASGVGAEIQGERLPLAAGATLEQALDGGEDYELLFTAARGTKVPGKIARIKLTRVGTVSREPGVRLDGEPLRAAGWEHFRRVS